jgi:hypothetical protein
MYFKIVRLLELDAGRLPHMCGHVSCSVAAEHSLLGGGTLALVPSILSFAAGVSSGSD